MYRALSRGICSLELANIPIVSLPFSLFPSPLPLFSERELTFTFAICHRQSVCRLSETFVRPTQAIEIFDNVSTPFSTVAIC